MRSMMRSLTALATAAAAALSVPTASAATIGGTDYAVQCDFPEFWTATDGKSARVFRPTIRPRPCTPSNPDASLLPVMQAAKPRPALAFT